MLTSIGLTLLPLAPGGSSFAHGGSCSLSVAAVLQGRVCPSGIAHEEDDGSSLHPPTALQPELTMQISLFGRLSASYTTNISFFIPIVPTSGGEMKVGAGFHSAS